MKIPFILRLKWIRLKDWVRSLIVNDHEKSIKPGWLIAAVVAGIGLMWALAGCSPAAQQLAVHSLEEGAPGKSVALPTSTPIQPTLTAAPTPLPLPTSTPVDPWENFPAPAESSAIELRRPSQAHPSNEQIVTIVVQGSDQRSGEYGHRSDAIMLFCIDVETNTVKILSIPRDLYIYLPGWRVDRINVADGMGGPEMVAETILYNFGLEVDHWVRVDFTGFMRVVDSLGGLEVEVTSHLSDFCGQHWSYSPGIHHMNGFQALCYVRMRKTTSDFDRLRREQEIAHALFKRVLSLDGLSRLPDLFNQYQDLVETDMGLGDLLTLLPVALEASKDSSRIEAYAIDSAMAIPWRVPGSGASVVLPQWENIGAMLQDSFGLPEQSWN